MALDGVIKGVNLGSWLLMEGYILGGRNIAESVFKAGFRRRYGAGELERFARSFRENFITEQDFRAIAAMGANAVRIPFNCRLIEPRPFRYSEEGVGYLETASRWAAQYGLKIILDMHAAPGAQNPDWHSDCRGRVGFWKDASCRERSLRIWEKLAQRFAGNAAVLGYDIINEPVLGGAREKILKEFYRDAIARIRAIDRHHQIFLEGHDWGRSIGFIRDLITDGVQVSVHFYEPFQYAFHLVPGYSFPGKIDGTRWDEGRLRRHLESYYRFSRAHRVKIFVGEFGVNWRGGFYGETAWLSCVLRLFREFGFGYTYWTYKAVAGRVYPDGLFQYLPDARYVRREGPVYGWENYLACWGKDKRDIARFWRTSGFAPNAALIARLREDFRS